MKNLLLLFLGAGVIALVVYAFDAKAQSISSTGGSSTSTAVLVNAFRSYASSGKEFTSDTATADFIYSEFIKPLEDRVTLLEELLK